MSSPSVPLPHRPAQDNATKAPVWPIVASEASVPAPLAAKCAAPSREDGICCKDLKDDERTLIDPDVVRDV